jgi:polyhydroxyalkanoate synthesis regulator phasin
MQAVDIRANSAGMAVASAYAVGALFDTLVASGILTREEAGAALHDALTALGHRQERPKGSKPQAVDRPTQVALVKLEAPVTWSAPRSPAAAFG